MKPYKLILRPSEFAEMYRLVRSIFGDRNVRDALTYLEFYNVAHLLKRMTLKMFTAFPTRPDRKKRVTFNIDPNQAKSFQDLLLRAPAYVEINEFSQAVILNISGQLDRCENSLDHLKLNS